MRSRSAVRGRLGTSPAPSGQRRLGGVLALQRMAGNRAVRALIARDAKVIKIGNESVRVASDAEKAEAERIIKDVKTKFGVSFDSLAAHKATMADSEGSAPEDRRKALAVRPWELDELKAIERALTHFAPGARRGAQEDDAQGPAAGVRQRRQAQHLARRRPEGPGRPDARPVLPRRADVRGVRARPRLADRRRRRGADRDARDRARDLRPADRLVHARPPATGRRRRSSARRASGSRARRTATPTATRARTWPSRSCTSSSTPSA